MENRTKRQPRASKSKASPSSLSIRKTFRIPTTITQAKELGLADANFTDSQIARIMPHPQSIMVTENDTVPVGHFWKPGPVNGDFMLACYRNETDGCHWVKVPASAPPEWDPHPDDD